MKKARPFDHPRAQEYEQRSSNSFLDKHFEEIFSMIQKNVKKRIKSPGIGEMNMKGFYGGDKKVWKKVAKHIEGKTCMEIGPGPCGNLTIWWFAKRRILIDPLLDEYRDYMLKRFKKTWYDQSLELYDRPAEEIIPDLEGKIDGVLVCRNTLDHCANPWKVLENIGKYAKTGCYLLLWTDLWHLEGTDDGHRNITKDVKTFADAIRRIGFDIEYSFTGMRGDGSTIDYGCRAVKRGQIACIPTPA